MTRSSKLPRAFLAFVLICSMAFCLLCPAVGAANRDNVQHYDTYMCIGDSIAAGYTVSGEQGNYYRVRVPGAYHDIIATATGAKLNQFGWSAFRSVELRYMLEGVRHDLDDAWLNTFSSLVRDEVLDANREDYLNAIKTSDLITINLGSNDVLSYSMTKTMELLEDSDDCELAAKAKELIASCGDLGTAFIKLCSYAELAGKLPIVLASFNPTLMKALQYFQNNFNACMKGIYALNPDATIVVVGVYNPLTNLTLTENTHLKLAPLVQPTVDLLNTFLKCGCNYASRYLFAPVPNTETWPFSVLGKDFRSQILWAVHPTVKGHAYMADQILSVLPEAQQSSPASDTGKCPFADIKPLNWFYEHVKYIWERGVMQGMTETTFAPDANTTRAQFATVLYRMAGSPKVTAADKASCPFADLTSGWYRDAVVWAYQNGVINGTSAKTFAPEQNISREQMVTMLWRYDGQKNANGTLNAFADRGSISAYAVPAVVWAVRNGFVNGMSDGSFLPNGLANRAQLAAILHRYMAK